MSGWLGGVDYLARVAAANAELAALAATFNWQAPGVPAGAINGANLTYTLPQLPKRNPAVFLSGVYAKVGIDYSIVGVNITILGAALNGTETIAFGEYPY